MGFIPIFVALLGLIFLYTGYTYNLIKPRKAKVNGVINTMAKLSGERKALILKYDAANPNSSVEEAANALKKTSTDSFQSFKKEEDLINVINSALENLTDDSLKKELTEKNAQQEQYMKSLKSAISEYNSMISKAPASFVASIFGFRKF